MKATWKMSRQELAKVFAEHFGFTGRLGGWIYSPTGQPITQGWDSFASKLQQRGWIIQGTGINWRAAGEAPKL
jgi:hypothetical protein